MPVRLFSRLSLEIGVTDMKKLLLIALLGLATAAAASLVPTEAQAMLWRGSAS
jgi:hypothetical protein